MSLLQDSPAELILIVLLLAGAAAVAVRGTRLFSLGLRDPDHPDQTLRVVRGMRGGIIAIALIFLALGVHFSNRLLLIFGAIFLGEELLETGIMIFVLRLQRKKEGTTK